ncbi:MAG TPA: hypothetical protein VK832_10710, partial [Burkholderiaceae bacterium]|nr:hypothetical protein [Burkholderiaceae bacterium]
MPTFNGFADSGRKTAAQDIVRRAGACCGIAEAGMSSWNDYTKKTFSKWFGVASTDERAVVSNKIYRMNFYFHNLPIIIEDSGATLG